MATSTSRWWALAALSLSTIAIGLDGTVLSVALPTLAGDLNASTGDLQWFTTSYLLVLAAALLPAGMLGDRFGRKRMLLGALAVFGIASAACSYATTSGQLIGARAALGLGAAVIMPLSSAVLTVIFEPAERTRALTVWITANTLGIPLGPLVGGWLLDHFWWGSVFLINLPLVVVGIVAVALWVPESHGDRTRRFDPAGIVLSAVGLVVTTYGIIEAGERGWSDPRSLVTVAAGVAVMAAFVLWQRRAQAPLVDLALFRSRAFTWGSILATVASFAMFGLLFALPLFYQAVRGNDAFGTGLRLLPVIGGLMVGARLAGRLEPKLGAKAVVTAGLVMIAGSLFAGTATGPGTGYGFVAAWITVTGVGLGFTMPPAMNAALGALSKERSGVGSGLIQAMRQVGSAIGVAVLGTVLNSAYRDGIDGSGLPAAARESVSAGMSVAARLGDPAAAAVVRSAFTDGMGAALLVAGVIAVAGAILSVAFLPGRPAAPANPEEVTLPPVSPQAAAESTV
ncbi:MFS transporter [Actinoplanes sp. NBRC 14428]|uniref:EmrB/QacA subfamily drug resistance transporter n=1 Tax=Pseudosporangium ferrugineum TaxID=439699 RepID=A0A2T0SIS2_9ACTN|nr:DHA2 family efflux MFS transporter permease subunit [Pseudosporangium ferrugineum]PRY33263.1 EmrB/QacA subfamily drug resistance transporter [Pseudosporangium ferrugineum]BCJ48740.1 MFS transporter [Actinoplanes sp. NBRC 14428]